jgi:hypothetical protein
MVPNLNAGIVAGGEQAIRTSLRFAVGLTRNHVEFCDTIVAVQEAVAITWHSAPTQRARHHPDKQRIHAITWGCRIMTRLCLGEVESNPRWSFFPIAVSEIAEEPGEVDGAHRNRPSKQLDGLLDDDPQDNIDGEPNACRSERKSVFHSGHRGAGGVKRDAPGNSFRLVDNQTRVL